MACQQVTAIQQCSQASLNVDCFNCDATYLATGDCLPGLYAYQFTLTNSEGYTAVPLNVTVQIYEQVSMWVGMADRIMLAPSAVSVCSHMRLLNDVSCPSIRLVPAPSLSCVARDCSAQGKESD